VVANARRILAVEAIAARRRWSSTARHHLPGAPRVAQRLRTRVPPLDRDRMAPDIEAARRSREIWLVVPSMVP
jgi:histidine ammonia-lyase